MPQFVIFQEYPARWDYVFNNPNGMVGRWLWALANDVVFESRRRVGVRTGNLRQSIHIMKRSRYGSIGHHVEVGSRESYALVHHEGSRPHTITANFNQFMKFSVKGRTVITRVVRHPGTRANKYLDNSLKLVINATTLR